MAARDVPERVEAGEEREPEPERGDEQGRRGPAMLARIESEPMNTSVNVPSTSATYFGRLASMSFTAHLLGPDD